MTTLRPLLIPAFVVAVIALAGCGKQADTSANTDSPAAPAKIRLAAVPKATTHSYWKAAEAGARRAAAEFNVELEWQGPLDDSKVADQIGIFNNLAASGLQGILLSPTDDKALAPHVRTAARRGLPIAIFDSPLDATAGTDYINFIATDNKAAGGTAARTLEALIGGSPAHGGQVLMIRFTEGSASTRLREEGFTAELANYPALKLAAQQFTDGSMAGAQRVAETLLGNYVKNNKLELAGVFASNQPTAEGTYNALKALRDKGVEVTAKVVGFDDSTLLIQGLHNGVIDALVVQDPEKMGYLGIKSLVEHLQGKPVQAYIDTGVSVKTKANTSAP
ncbi:MAG: substrate-binding domain-containing protein [Opitutaceae bacterium]|nr:substrate-binding domain-containing protein [Opitutaceae bacterium]